MEITYLGTAAAEGWPSVFCECAACKNAAKSGGRDIRTRSQTVIDGELLIDFPADTYMHALYGKLDLNAVNHIIITHSHEDHFYPSDLLLRSRGFADFDRNKILTLHGNRTVIDLLEAFRGKGGSDFGDMEAHCRLTEAVAYQPFAAGKYNITPLKADHVGKPGETPFIYLIEKGGKSLLYAHDTGYFPDETWDHLKREKLDMVSLDCTILMDPAARNYHMGLPCCAEVKRRLTDEKIAGEDTIFIVNHFSHNGKGGLLYDELSREAAKYDIRVSYDGMSVGIG
jgi:phosphoribosyl 1,2-cyclic phosphate phosphodiesterase